MGKKKGTLIRGKEGPKLEGKGSIACLRKKGGKKGKHALAGG